MCVSVASIVVGVLSGCDGVLWLVAEIVLNSLRIVWLVCLLQLVVAVFRRWLFLLCQCSGLVSCRVVVFCVLRWHVVLDFRVGNLLDGFCFFQ